jgi:hypothetical protein
MEADMSSQEHNMAVLGQIVKHIPAKLIEKLKAKHKIQTRSFSETSHVVAMIFAQLSHALSLNDICDCLRFHKGYLAQIRDCVPPSRNGLAHANATRDDNKRRQNAAKRGWGLPRPHVLKQRIDDPERPRCQLGAFTPPCIETSPRP